MRRSVFALALASLSIVGFTTHAIAAENKLARGTVVSINAGAVTVAMPDGDRRFTVDNRTTIEAVGAGTMTRRATADGKPGPKLGDVLKVGQAVEVTYDDVNGAAHAKRIRRVASTSVKAADERPRKTSSGTVKSFADNALTISGRAGSGATFEQTFIIDSNTKLFGKGFGTAAAKSGGRLPAAGLIANGDTVAVSYNTMGSALRAADVRVITKATR
jgi:hypothetical protein